MVSVRKASEISVTLTPWRYSSDIILALWFLWFEKMWLFCKDLKASGSAWRCGIETNKGRLGRVGRMKTAELPAVCLFLKDCR